MGVSEANELLSSETQKKLTAKFSAQMREVLVQEASLYIQAE